MKNYKLTFNLGCIFFTCTYFATSIKDALNMAKNEHNVHFNNMVSCKTTILLT